MNLQSDGGKPSDQTKEIYAVILDDDGEMHELTAYYGEGENKFEAIEQEAKERGLRYANTFMFQLKEAD